MAEVEFGVAWFPAGEFEAALELWPGFIEWPVGDHADYCAHIEADLRRYPDGAELGLAPIRLGDYLPWCEEESLNPAKAETRARYAGVLARRGQLIPWPLGRNESCWCGSGQMYQWCCGKAGGG